MEDQPHELDQFQEEQRSGLGATDTPKLLGHSKYGSALTVYHSKVDPQPRDTMSLPAWMGLRIQDVVAALYTEATGNAVRAARGHYRHPVLRHIVCHLDYKVRGNAKILVEAKTRMRMDGWGPDGSTKIPVDIWEQVQHEMLVTGATETHVAVLFGHHTFRVYRIQRDEAFLGVLMPKLDDFWHDHVLARVPPLATANELDRALLGDEFPESGPMYRNATPEQEELVRKYRHRAKMSEEAGTMLAEAQNQIIQVIGPHLGLIGTFGRITYKKIADSDRVAWRKLAEAYEQALDAALSLAAPSDEMGVGLAWANVQSIRDEARALLTTPVDGTRRWNTDFQEG